MADSPRTLYEQSLRVLVTRLNNLCHYVKDRHRYLELYLQEQDGYSKPSLEFGSLDYGLVDTEISRNPLRQLDGPLCQRRGSLNSQSRRRKLGMNLPDESEEDEEEEEEETETDKNLCDDFASKLGTSSLNRANSNAENNNNEAKALKNRMKKGYHSLLNTFIFGGSSSKGKPPMSPNIASNSSSSSVAESEHDRLRVSYRVSADLVEDIFGEYQRHFGSLSDRALKLAIFSGAINQMRSIVIKDASALTTAGLSALSAHPHLKSLSVAHLSTSVSVNELIGCLSPVATSSHLESLSVRHCTFNKLHPFSSSSKSACLAVLALAQLPKLSTLDVSYTDFNNHALEVVLEDLPFLSSLNISATKVTLLQPLASRNVAARLRVLIAHNTAGSARDETHTISQLYALEKLDISDSRSYLDTTQNPIKDKLLRVLANASIFYKLSELDISGRNGVDYADVERLLLDRQFFSSGMNKSSGVAPLRFLGLLETNLNYDDLLDLMKASLEPITLTGNGNLQHIMESLRRYSDCAVFVQKSLLHLYQMRFNLESAEMAAARPAIISLIVDLLTTYLSSVNIVLVSTACLYIFTQMNVFAGNGGVSGKAAQQPLHPHLLASVVKVNMLTMSRYATNQPVMKNILLTLCSDRILQEIPFDRMSCMQQVMDSLITFTEPTLNRLALAVCSILAAKIPTEQTTSIGAQVKYMGRLLEFVQRSNAAIDTDSRDVLFKLALSALWNFTDESPKTCQAFIENRGLQLYIEALMLFQGQNSVETKILGLINNIAEVPYLRKYLVDGSLLANLKALIQSEHIDISYFSAGILAQLASDRSLDWTKLVDFSLTQVLDEMKQVILNWKTPNFEMVAYRSFVPFIALLTCRPHPAVQLWALWAIHHVCTKSGSQKYCQMLYDERCLSLIADILDEQIKITAKTDKPSQINFLRKRLVGVAANYEVQKSNTELNNLPQCTFLFSACVTAPSLKEVSKVLVSDEDRQAMEFREQSNQLSLFTCDCKLQHYLAKDPFLSLPALILRTFAEECPRLATKEDFRFECKQF